MRVQPASWLFRARAHQAGVAVAVLLSSEGAALALGSLFVYQPGGGAPPVWNDVRNWSQDGLPPPASRVPGTDQTDRAVIVGNTDGTGDWTLTDLTINGAISRGTFAVNGVLTMDTGASGAPSFNGCNLTLLGGATMVIAGTGATDPAFNSVSLDNQGTMSVTRGITLGVAFGLPSTILVNHGTIAMTDQSNLRYFAATTNSLLINNNLIIKQATTNAAGVADIHVNYFANSSTGFVQTAGGQLRIDSDAGTNYGALVAAAAGSNSTINLSGLVLADGSLGQGPGRILVNGAGVYLAGAATLQNLDLAGKLFGPGTLTLTGACNLAGTLQGITDTNGFVIDSSPQCIISSGALVNATGGQFARDFINHGDLRLTGTISALSGGTPQTTTHLTNAPGGTLEILGGLGLGGSGAVVCNNNLMVCSNSTFGGNTLVFNLGDFQLVAGNAGAQSLTQTAGRTFLGTNTQFTVAAPFLMSFQGGSIEGFGSLNPGGGTITVAATVSPGASPGLLTFLGNTVLQSPSAILRTEIGGYQPGVDFDRVNISGQASLGGALNVSFTGGFVAVLGDTFEILHCTARAGAFGTVSGVHAPNGLVLIPRYSATNVVLIAANDLSLSSPRQIAGQLQFDFMSTAGFSYVVEFAPSLVAPVSWQPLGSVLLGSGSLLTVVDPSPSISQRFYRVRFQ